MRFVTVGLIRFFSYVAEPIGSTCIYLILGSQARNAKPVVEPSP